VIEFNCTEVCHISGVSKTSSPARAELADVLWQSWVGTTPDHARPAKQSVLNCRLLCIQQCVEGHEDPDAIHLPTRLYQRRASKKTRHTSGHNNLRFEKEGINPCTHPVNKERGDLSGTAATLLKRCCRPSRHSAHGEGGNRASPFSRPIRALHITFRCPRGQWR
jgi:hypothetical protein